MKLPGTGTRPAPGDPPTVAARYFLTFLADFLAAGFFAAAFFAAGFFPAGFLAPAFLATGFLAAFFAAALSATAFFTGFFPAAFFAAGFFAVAFLTGAFAFVLAGAAAFFAAGLPGAFFLLVTFFATAIATPSGNEDEYPTAIAKPRGGRNPEIHHSRRGAVESGGPCSRDLTASLAPRSLALLAAFFRPSIRRSSTSWSCWASMPAGTPAELVFFGVHCLAFVAELSFALWLVVKGVAEPDRAASTVSG